MPGAIFPIGLLLESTAKTGPLTKVDKELEALGARLRLTGRDMMRLGGTMSRFFGMLERQIGTVLKGSLMWEAGLEDISWALEDVGYVLGDLLAPVLDIAANLIESFADALERYPVLQYLSVIAIGLVIFGKFMGILLSTIGSLTLYIGTVLVARRANLGLWTTLKAVWIQFTRGDEALRSFIARQKGYGITGAELGKTLEGLTDKQKKMVAQLYGVDKALSDSFGKGQQKNVRTLSDRIKALRGGLKKTFFFGLKLAFVFGMLGLSFLVLPAIMEDLQDLFEVITDALAPFIDTIREIIWWISDWIEENPELFRTLLLAAVAMGGVLVLLSKLGILGKIGGKVAEKLGLGITKVTDATVGASKGLWKEKLATAAVVAALALLMVTITQFFATLLGMGVGLWEAIAALVAVGAALIGFVLGLSLAMRVLGNLGPTLFKGVAALLILTAAVWLLTFALGQFLQVVLSLPGGIGALWQVVAVLLVFIGVLALISAVLGMLGPLALIGATSLLILGAAITLVGLGFLLFGEGLQLVASGLTQLAAVAPSLFVLGGALVGVAAGLGLLAVSAALAIVPVTLLAGALFILSASIVALAGAFALLHGLGLGGVAEAMGTALVATIVPKLQEGGLIAREGIAYLHTGEEVLPAAAVRRKKETPAPPPVTININAPIGSREIAESFAKEIERILDRQFKRSR